MFPRMLRLPRWALGFCLWLVLCGTAQATTPAADEAESDSSDFIIGEFLENQDQQNPHAQDQQSSGPDVPAKQKTSELPKYEGVPSRTELPTDAVDLIWKIIDANQDNRATDREVEKALRGARAEANHKEVTPVRAAIRARFDLDSSGMLDKQEALALVCEVRGLRCPTAALARAYWKSLDDDHSNTVSSEEFASRIEPLGKVGEAMARMLSNTLKNIDRDGSHAVDELELYYSANTMLRIQLATEGQQVASRHPAYWLKFVAFVANFDLDADNLVSPAESMRVPALQPHFNRIDKNGDKQLSASELCDYREHIDHLIAAARAASFRGSC